MGKNFIQVSGNITKCIQNGRLRSQPKAKVLTLNLTQKSPLGHFSNAQITPNDYAPTEHR